MGFARIIIIIIIIIIQEAVYANWERWFTVILVQDGDGRQTYRVVFHQD